MNALQLTEHDRQPSTVQRLSRSMQLSWVELSREIELIETQTT